jgi:hypothetical protein
MNESQCRCGHSRNDKIVMPESEYSWLGLFLICFGISSCPRAVKFVCPKCRHLFETVTEPERCNKYRYRT